MKKNNDLGEVEEKGGISYAKKRFRIWKCS